MLWTYFISDLNRDEYVGRFYEKVLQKLNPQEFTVEKVVKVKDDKQKG